MEEINVVALLTKILSRGGVVPMDWAKGPNQEYFDTKRKNLQELMEAHLRRYDGLLSKFSRLEHDKDDQTRLEESTESGLSWNSSLGD